MPTVLKSGRLNLLEPSGPVQACNGIALPLPVLNHGSSIVSSLSLVPIPTALSRVLHAKTTLHSVILSTVKRWQYIKIYTREVCLSSNKAVYFILEIWANDKIKKAINPEWNVPLIAGMLYNLLSEIMEH